MFAGKKFGGPTMFIRVCRVGKPEGGRSRNDNREAVGYERLVRVSRGPEGVLEASYGVGTGVRYDGTNRAEPDSGNRGGEHHVSASLHVTAIRPGAP